MKQTILFLSALFLCVACTVLCGCKKRSAPDIDKLTCFIDLHLHLDGSISVKSARELAKMQNIPVPEDDDDLAALLQADGDCNSLVEFLEKFDFPCSLTQTGAALKKATENLLSELKEDGVMYAEIRFAPQNHTALGMTQREAVAAVLDGIRASDIPCGLILCCMRGEGTDAPNRETVEIAAEYFGKGVCALDIAGDEAAYPITLYADFLSAAKEKGIPLTLHAGEAAGAESVRDTVNLGAVRIGHGVRASEDEATIALLREKNITLETCPTSNLYTGIYDSISDFPLRQFIGGGVKITVNTDDMSVCKTDIKSEYKKLIKEFGLTSAEVKMLLQNAVEASFAGDELKSALSDEINRQIK